MTPDLYHKFLDGALAIEPLFQFLQEDGHYLVSFCMEDCTAVLPPIIGFSLTEDQMAEMTSQVAYAHYQFGGSDIPRTFMLANMIAGCYLMLAKREGDMVN
jgi:hypothetical protein